MRLEVISDLQALSRVRPHWDAVYDTDPEAHFFLSWRWMAKRLEGMGASWFVLAAKTEAAPPDYVAFFPLRARRAVPRNDAPIEVATAGSPVADYTGLLCMPRHQAQAIPLFARYVREFRKRIRWTTLRLDQVRISEERLRLFLAYYRGEDYELLRESRINRDGIDNAVCPRVDLPGSWDAYLSERVGANTRQKLRRFLRRVETSPEFDLAEATAETVEEDLRSLLRLWEGQWADRKRGVLDRIRQQSLAMLTDCFEAGSLFLPVLRRNGSVVAALAIFTDQSKKSYLFYMGGRDEAVGGLSPGLVLHAFAIRHAISRGFRTYDFLRGDEPYKFSLGGRRDFIQTIVVRARTDAGRDEAPGRAGASAPPPPALPSGQTGGPASQG
jgi:CelD/BcsL family acetyltransferase involved in cellulose biosynthesis